jgi:hypothetical protein
VKEQFKKQPAGFLSDRDNIRPEVHLPVAVFDFCFGQNRPTPTDVRIDARALTASLFFSGRRDQRKGAKYIP